LFDVLLLSAPAAHISCIFRMRTSSTMTIQKLFFFFYICITWRVSCKRQELLTIREHRSSPPEFTPGVLVGSMLVVFLVFCVVLLFVFTFCDDRYCFRIQRCSVRLYLQLFGGGLMSYLRYLCFTCALLCPTHIVLCFCFFVFFFASCAPYVASFSGLSISDCPFGIL